MQQDIRNTALYREAQALYDALHRPGTDQISDARELHVSPDGRLAAFTGTILESLEGTPLKRIGLTDIATGATRVLTFGPNADRSPQFSPDGRRLAFLSDRHQLADFQLYLLDVETGATRATPHVPGWVEYLQWSPDGRRVLLGVAGHGADISGGQGAITSQKRSEGAPSWMPIVEAGDEDFRWRSAWIYECATGTLRQVSQPGNNIWETCWYGNDALAAIASSGPSEGLWYTATLRMVGLRTAECREIYRPQNQLGWPAASPSGRYLAVVEAICSDRCLVAGDLKLIDTDSNEPRFIETHGVDITHTEWRSDRHLLLAGHRGFEIVIGITDAALGSFKEIWSSSDICTGGRYITVSGVSDAGDCALIGESFTRAPELGLIRAGAYATVKSFDVDPAKSMSAIEAVSAITWRAPDDLEIQGWLLRPKGQGPHPLVMCIHGGPVWQWHPMWLGRPRYTPYLMLVAHGYAVFLPNPRGSSGRGQEFAGRVLGDIGGADTYDYLSGIDTLVDRGIADPQRLGVTGVSYGGFMSAWLITQDSRFAAAVAVSPVSNQVTQHLLSNIPHFVELFLRDKYNHSGGKYFDRSPIMHAHKAKTPTLIVCGALDRCTPPAEAVQFHHALLEHGATSVLVKYPQEGHGIESFPAAIDYAARVVYWMGKYAPARS